VQSSYWESTLESAPTLLAADQPAIRLGLQNIKGLSQAGAERLIQSREAGSWTSLGALKQKAQLDQKDLDRLVDSGACLRLSGHRHQSHWQATGFAAPPPLFEPLGWASGDEVTLNAPSEIEDIKADYNSLKFTLGRHPMNIIRPQNKALKRTLEATQLPSIRHGRFVEVAGLVTGRQRPSTASGIIFMTLEDDTGNINVVIFNTVLERFRAETLKGQLLRVKGILERKGSVIHVVAGHLEDLSFLLKDFSMKSRDFH
jgi:error-prone DNA polymerase